MRDPQLPPQQSLRWMSEYQRQFVWNRKNQPATTKSLQPVNSFNSNQSNQSNLSNVSSKSIRSDASDDQQLDPLDVAAPTTDFDDADDLEASPELVSQLKNLVRLYSAQRRRPHAAGPHRRPSDVKLTPADSGAATPHSRATPSIQDEYKNIMSQYGSSAPSPPRPASHASYPSSIPRYQDASYSSPKPASIVRPYSPAASYTSADIQQEMDRRYSTNRVKNIRVDEVDLKAAKSLAGLPDEEEDQENEDEEQPDSQSTAFRNQNKNAFRQPDTHHVGFLPANSTTKPTATRLRSPPPPSTSSRSTLPSPPPTSQTPREVLSEKLHKTHTQLLANRQETYQSEYTRAFRSWIPALTRIDTKTAELTAKVLKDAKTAAAAAAKKQSTTTTQKPPPPRTTPGFSFYTQGPPDTLPAPAKRVLPTSDMPAAGIAYPKSTTGVRELFQQNTDVPDVPPPSALKKTAQVFVEEKPASGGGGRRKEGGSRILQFAVEPPPTWNLAQEILQRARVRRNQFVL
ncbi:hypothetical protein HDU99_000084 [Rhizoclosmatium hyalinum]|nr:hypothetical protein HDU99_000084 [Rhizoclosmatium hyalinum]